MFTGGGVSADRLAPRISLALAAGSVLVVVPDGFVPFLFPKLALLALAVVLSAAGPGAGRLPGWAGALALVGGAAFVAAALAGGTPAASLLGRWPRYEGLPVLALAGGCAWAGARLLGPRAPAERWRWAGGAATLVAVVLLLESLLEAFGLRPLGTAATRSGSLLGNATDQGLVGAGLAVLLLAAVGSAAGRDRLAAAIGCASATGTVLLSGSRTSVVALAVGLVVLAAVRRRRGPALTSVGVAAALACGVLLVPPMRDRLTSGHTVVGRRLLWQESWRIARDHLGPGIGPSRLVDVLPAHHTAEWVERVGTANPPDSPHDLLLQLLLAGGMPLLLVGGAAIVLVGLVGLRSLGSRPEVGALLAVLAVGLSGLLVNPTSPPVTCLLALLAGAVVAADPPAGPGERLAVGGVAALLAAATLSASASEVVLHVALDTAAVGDPAAAGRLLDTARALRGDDSDICLIGAQALAQRADSTSDAAVRQSAATEVLRLGACALRRTPDAVGALTAVGVAYLDLGDRQAALDALGRALALDPTNAQVTGLVARAQAAG